MGKVVGNHCLVDPIYFSIAPHRHINSSGSCAKSCQLHRCAWTRRSAHAARSRRGWRRSVRRAPAPGQSCARPALALRYCSRPSPTSWVPGITATGDCCVFIYVVLNFIIILIWCEYFHNTIEPLLSFIILSLENGYIKSLQICMQTTKNIVFTFCSF